MATRLTWMRIHLLCFISPVSQLTFFLRRCKSASETFSLTRSSPGMGLISSPGDSKRSLSTGLSTLGGSYSVAPCMRATKTLILWTKYKEDLMFVRKPTVTMVMLFSSASARDRLKATTASSTLGCVFSSHFTIKFSLLLQLYRYILHSYLVVVFHWRGEVGHKIINVSRIPGLKKKGR